MSGTQLNELIHGGADIAKNTIKKETRDVYDSYFKRFAKFCVDNGYPHPAEERHYELPSLLVAFMQSISASPDVSHQTAEKTRAAVANYFSSFLNRDGTGGDTWLVKVDEDGVKRGCGNPAKDAFVRQFMRGLKKKKSVEYVQSQAAPISLQMLATLHDHLTSKEGLAGFSSDCRHWFMAVSSMAFYEMCRINEVLTIKWKDVLLFRTRQHDQDGSVIEFGTYVLHDRKTDVAEGRAYNLHKLDASERAIDAYFHLTNWAKYLENTRRLHCDDDEYVFPALSKVSKKYLQSKTRKTHSSAPQMTGCEQTGLHWGKKMSEQTFITVLNCMVQSLNNQRLKPKGYLKQQWTNVWFTSHTFRRAGAQYRFMYADTDTRWSLRMIKWWAGWSLAESAETLVRYL